MRWHEAEQHRVRRDELRVVELWPTLGQDAQRGRRRCRQLVAFVEQQAGEHLVPMEGHERLV